MHDGDACDNVRHPAGPRQDSDGADVERGFDAIHSPVPAMTAGIPGEGAA
jgi:hypothetical protein